MNSATVELRKALYAELVRLTSVADLAVKTSNHLNGLTLNPDTERQDLVSESTVVKEIATLLQHAVQNLARNVGPVPTSRLVSGRGKS